jgi:hypothetical protein
MGVWPGQTFQPLLEVIVQMSWLFTAETIEIVSFFAVRRNTGLCPFGA